MSALLNIYIIVKLQHIASYQHLSDVLQGLQASCWRQTCECCVSTNSHSMSIEQDYYFLKINLPKLNIMQL